ncbi:AbrB/MazE/SpoVT family DNA-binding domain-containing protein [Paenibacillus periandrae]|uniref:AbrB/MazE/SpoVT family DNA-binding domain-containing protein n=1 Tax=Paenibacillus periandrae TaxID=1761741 RepID=UPI001F08FA89|nr:AbrB/MazE/SpoVT family DNA-binding domain-containing protein [Paenibacillus periandrae]
MNMKVQKWGNSLGIRIPGPFAEQLNITEGSEVELFLLDKELIIRPTRQKLKLEDLLAGVTPENRHHEIDFGKPKGNETW